MKGNKTLLRRSLLSKGALYGDHICPSVHPSHSVSVRTVSLISMKFAICLVQKICQSLLNVMNIGVHCRNFCFEF